VPGGVVQDLYFDLQIFFQASQVILLLLPITPVVCPTIYLKRNQDTQDYDDQFQYERATVRFGEIFLQSIRQQWVFSLSIVEGNLRVFSGQINLFLV